MITEDEAVDYACRKISSGVAVKDVRETILLSLLLDRSLDEVELEITRANGALTKAYSIMVSGK